VTLVGKKCATSSTVLGVTSATLPEVTSATSHSDRGSDSRLRLPLPGVTSATLPEVSQK